MSKTPSKVIAGCFALAAFAVAVLAGLVSGNPAQSILSRALIAMIGCYPIGLIVGLICQRVMNDQIQAYRDAGSDSESTAKQEVSGSQTPVTAESQSE